MTLLDKFNIKITPKFEAFLDRNDIVITDRNVFKIYNPILKNNRVIVIEPGEDSKTLACVERIICQLIDMQADRNTVLVGFGGGLVCDVCGLVGSLYMRGVKFKFIATSLLAQLDASVGGKNGVNCDGYKNIIGVFNNPSEVVCACDVLTTLPSRELVSGYAEAIKCGIIANEKLFDLFEGDVIDLQEIVRLSLDIKAEIVDKDPKETLGWRKLLNLGHTFGHAVEKCVPNRFLHGEAVAIGLCYAAKGSLLRGLCEKETVDRVLRIIKKVGLPCECDVESHDLAQAMLVDKKRGSDKIDFILIKSVGEVCVTSLEANVSVLEEFLVSLRKL